jgi:hypothetical protein
MNAFTKLTQLECYIKDYLASSCLDASLSENEINNGSGECTATRSVGLSSGLGGFCNPPGFRRSGRSSVSAMVEPSAYVIIYTETA